MSLSHTPDPRGKNIPQIKEEMDALIMSTPETRSASNRLMAYAQTGLFTLGSEPKNEDNQDTTELPQIYIEFSVSDPTLPDSMSAEEWSTLREEIQGLFDQLYRGVGGLGLDFKTIESSN